MSQEVWNELFKGEEIKTPVESDLDFVELTRKGISKKTLLKLAEVGAISLKSLAQLLPISERTIQRYNENERFKSDVTEHIILIAKVIFKGLEVFDNREDLKEWLTTPSLGLGEQTPLSLLDTSFGTQMVMDELGRLEYGVYS